MNAPVSSRSEKKLLAPLLALPSESSILSLRLLVLPPSLNGLVGVTLLLNSLVPLLLLRRRRAGLFNPNDVTTEANRVQ